MRGYDRYEEDLDEYEDEEGDELEEGAEEEHEEYEEEPPRQPTKEELEYLELRQHLKDSIRKQMKKEGGSSLSTRDKIKNPSDNYGSFFGPSQPVISQRVIQESKSLIENKHLASGIMNRQNSSRKNSSSAPSTSSGSKPANSVPTPRFNSGLKNKAQKLKDTRDYSFLFSDDVEIPAPTKQPPPRNAFASNPDVRSSHLQQINKQQLGSNGRPVNGSHQDRKAVGMNGYQKSKIELNKPSSGKPSSIGSDSRKQIVNHGSGPGRPIGPKGLPQKTPISAMERRDSVSGAKSSTSGVQKMSSSKMQAAVSKQRLEQRREPTELNRSKLMTKPLVPAQSKPQINKKLISSYSTEKKKTSSYPIDQRTVVPKAPVQRKVPSHVSSQDQRPKKRPARPFEDDDDGEDDGKAISMIRKMFGYNPNRYRDDDDDSDMEAGFDDIMKEEKRSALIAKKEDDEQLRLIEEEERREMMRKKMAKKRKLMSH